MRRQYVDDLLVAVHGAYSSVSVAAKRACILLLRELIRRRCSISSKIVVLATSCKLRRSLWYYLRCCGFKFKHDTQARDRGVDTSFGRRRCTRTAATRVASGRRRVRHAHQLARASPSGPVEKLVGTNIMPASLWGFQIRGVAPSILNRIRGSLPKLFFPQHHRGMCTTTILQIGLGPHQDPAVCAGRVCLLLCSEVLGGFG